MNSKLIVILMCVAGLFSACHSDDIPEPPTIEPAPAVADRTVLVYIASDSPGNNDLSSFAEDDLAEMVKGIVQVDTRKNNLIVYVDRTSAGGKYTPQLIRICKNTANVAIRDTIHSYSARNSVGVSEMTDVFSEVFADYPASCYGLVLWSHGEGWLKANKPATQQMRMVRSFGDDNGTGMNISELNDVLKTTQLHFDYLMFDACFMQTVEVAYELRSRTDYIIACPAEIPGEGAPYDNIVPAMFAGTSNTEDIVKNIVQKYYQTYVDASDKVAIGVLKTSELEQLADATRQILQDNLAFEEIKSISNLLQYGGYSERKYYYTDMNAFIRSITPDDMAYNQWKQSFDKVLISYEHTPTLYSKFMGDFSMEGSCGMAMYVPCVASYYYSPTKNRDALNEFFRTYEWYTATGWAEKGW